MRKRQCAVCGKDPAEGYASIYQHGKQEWYCHPDDGESCYMAKSASTWAEAMDVLLATPIETIRAEILKRRDAWQEESRA